MVNMVEAMAALGIDGTARSALFDLVAFVLKLGEVQSSEGDAATIATGEVVAAAGKLIGVADGELAKALCNRTVVTRGESISTPLNQAQSVLFAFRITSPLFAFECISSIEPHGMCTP